MEHVIITAIVVDDDESGYNRQQVEEWLHARLPATGRRGDESLFIDSWWIAEDSRYDRSDNDSAVFCIPGKQIEARDALRALGLAPY